MTIPAHDRMTKEVFLAWVGDARNAYEFWAGAPSTGARDAKSSPSGDHLLCALASRSSPSATMSFWGPRGSRR